MATKFQTHRLALFTSFALLVLLAAPFAFASNSGVTYQGRILKPDGTPLSGANTQFRLQIRTPDSQNCLMYEEVQSQDLRATSGSFSLAINDGTGSRTDSTSLTLDRIFANHGSFTFDPSTCSVGLGVYTPNSGDGRNLVVQFKDETMSAWEPIPAQRINFVPFAFESKQIQGFTSEALLRVVDSSGTPVISGISPLSNAQYTELLALIAGTSTSFAKLGGASIPSTASLSNGQVLTWNSSTTSWAAGSSTVQSPDTATTVSFAVPNGGASYTVTYPPAAGASGQTLALNSSGAFVWTTPASGAYGEFDVVEKDADGAAQTNCTAGSWIPRTLNTVVQNSITGASLSSNQITLPAGTFVVEGSALAFSTNIHQAVLYNVTSASFDVLGTLSRSTTSSGTITDSLLMGKITLAAPAVFELRHRCEASGQFTRGSPGWGVPSLSVIVKIRKIQ